MNYSGSDSGGEDTSTGVVEKKKHGQRYKKNWENVPEFKGCLTEIRKGKSYGRLKCNDKHISISGRKKDALIKHNNVRFHRKKAHTKAQQRALTSFPITESSAKKLDEDVKEGKLRHF
jgi:hypothetical protein